MATNSNVKKYERYKAEHRYEKNKIKKLRKHLRSHPNDVKIATRIQELEVLVAKK